MDNEQIRNLILDKSGYVGRAMAFNKDGSDFGIVTIIRVQLCLLAAILFVYDERNKETGTAMLSMDIDHIRSNAPKPVAPYGREYIYSCQTQSGETIYIENVN